MHLAESSLVVRNVFQEPFWALFRNPTFSDFAQFMALCRRTDKDIVEACPVT